MNDEHLMETDFTRRDAKPIESDRFCAGSLVTSTYTLSKALQCFQDVTDRTTIGAVVKRLA